MYLTVTYRAALVSRGGWRGPTVQALNPPPPALSERRHRCFARLPRANGALACDGHHQMVDWDPQIRRAVERTDRSPDRRAGCEITSN